MIQFPPNGTELFSYVEAQKNMELRTGETSQIAHRKTVRITAGAGEIGSLPSSHARLLEKLFDR